jgi:hypothetical protein
MSVATAVPTTTHDQVFVEQLPSHILRPRLSGIQHLTMKPSGDVLWKGKIVEQFSPAFLGEAFRRGGLAAELEMIAGVCRQLESKGITPSLESVCAWSPLGLEHDQHDF